MFALGLLGSGVIIFLLIWMLFDFFAGREAQRAVRQYPLAAGRQDRLPPGPRLQTNPREDLRELRAAEDAVLNSYGWLDKDNGIVRIPIDRAMESTVQRGLPARGKQ